MTLPGKNPGPISTLPVDRYNMLKSIKDGDNICKQPMTTWKLKRLTLCMQVFFLRQSFFRNILADVKKRRSWVRNRFPAFQRQALEDIRAVLWKLEASAALNVEHDFFVGFCLVRNFRQCGNFPENYAIAPNIGLACKCPITDWLWSHPTNRHRMVALCKIEIRCVHMTRHPKIANFNHFILGHQTVPSRQVSEIMF